MSPAWNPRGRAPFGLLAVIVAVSACEIERGEITIETVELASGEYYGLSWGGTQVERFHVLAREGSSSGDVVVVSPNFDEPCSLGPLHTYLPLQPMNGGEFVLGSPSPVRIAVFDALREDGSAALGFADLDCERIPFGVEDALPRNLLRLYEPDLMDLRWVVPTVDRTLMFVDPWAQTTSIVARDVSRVQPYQNGLWLVEAGRAVRRDLEGVELARFGNGVSELLQINRAGDVIYVDERGLVLRTGDVEMVVEDEDPCVVRAVSGFAARAIGYFSPCETRRFVVRQADGRKFTYPEHIDALAVLDGRLLFTIQGEETTALWIVFASRPMEPVLMGELPRFRLDSVSPSASGLTLIARQIADNTLSLITVETNAARDEFLFRTEREGIQELRTFDNAVAMLKTDGVLSLWLGNARELVRAQGVRPGGFRFVFDGDSAALTYVSDVDEDTGLGRLQMQFLKGPHFEVAENVREYGEVWWPEPGLLFATGGGDAGINFASVDIPCEMTSDAPWACGF